MGATPMSFVCPVARKNQIFDSEWVGPSGGTRACHRYPRGHEKILRTGRRKPNPSHNRSARISAFVWEFVCQCGHRGWSKLKDCEALPIDTSLQDAPRSFGPY